MNIFLSTQTQSVFKGDNEIMQFNLQIEDMINEVKFKDYAKTNKYVTKINLDDFIKR